MLNTLLQIGILILLAVAAIQDGRTWKVDVRITNTLFVLGVVGSLVSAACGDYAQLVAIVILLGFYSVRWLNHADVKLQTALFGLWPLAGMVGLFTVGVWGLVAFVVYKQKRFPAVVPLAIGAGLTFAISTLIIFLNCADSSWGRVFLFPECVAYP
jgi:hypothetical protein